MTTEPTPVADPVTDDEAYHELRNRAYTLDSEVRRIQREREVLRYEREREQQRLAGEKQAAELAEKYPNPVPSMVYELAQASAYVGDGEDPEEEAIAESYEQIVNVINAALEVRA